MERTENKRGERKAYMHLSLCSASEARKEKETKKNTRRLAVISAAVVVAARE
jgi:hypothetical protein